MRVVCADDGVMKMGMMGMVMSYHSTRETRKRDGVPATTPCVHAIALSPPSFVSFLSSCSITLMILGHLIVLHSKAEVNFFQMNRSEKKLTG